MTRTDNYFDRYANRRSTRGKSSDGDAKKASHRSKPGRRHLEPPPIPPVMVRGMLTGIPLLSRKRKKQKIRRRYDLSLNVPGAEMRLPAIPMVSFGYRLVSGVLFVALAMLIYHLWNSPVYQVAEAEIVGLRRLTNHDVNAAMDVAGELIFAVDAEGLQKRLQDAFPEFSSVSVQVGLPRTVRVAVEERQPILTWRQDGRTVLVDPNGVAFPLRDQVQSEPALVVEASNSPPAIEQDIMEDGVVRFLPVEMVSAILSMGAHTPENSFLVYDPEHGFGWRALQGWEVYFGDVRNIDMKLRIYEALVEKFGQEGINPALVSVEHVHSPYYRIER